MPPNKVCWGSGDLYCQCATGRITTSFLFRILFYFYSGVQLVCANDKVQLGLTKTWRKGESVSSGSIVNIKYDDIQKRLGL
jgi:hypothetical protein